MISTIEREAVVREKVLLISGLEYEISFIGDCLMSFAGRMFKTVIDVDDESIGFEAYLPLIGSTADGLRSEIKILNENPVLFRDGKRWARFAFTTKPEHLGIFAMIPVDKKRESTDIHAFFYYDEEFGKLFNVLKENKELIMRA